MFFRLSFDISINLFVICSHERGVFMYAVGFYSPKEKSGVTETSLSVFHWLKNHSKLSVCFISYGTLDKESIDDSVIQRFSELSLTEKKKTIKKLKNKFDIIVYDASSDLSDESLKVLSILDRLFILGEDNLQFAEKLHKLIFLNSTYDKKTKTFISHIQGSKTFILKEDCNQKLGFTKPEKNSEDIANIIYSDYITYIVENKTLDKNQILLSKVAKLDAENFLTELNHLGFDYEKCVLYQKYINLRIALGQDYDNAVESLFPTFVFDKYAEILKRFQSELYVAQITFETNQPSTEMEEHFDEQMELFDESTNNF